MICDLACGCLPPPPVLGVGARGGCTLPHGGPWYYRLESLDILHKK